MKQEGEVIQKFQEVLKNRHQYAKDWKARTGRRVVGCICSYVPVEIIHAAGMLPVRILGGHEIDRVSDTYLYGFICTFCRDSLSQGLRGKYDYLDGVVFTRTCDATEIVFHNWSKFLPVEFSHFIFAPGNLIQSPKAEPYLVKEFNVFKEKLEGLRGKAITEAELKDSVEAFNENRRLMKQVYEYRKADKPPLTGKEALEIAIANQVMDVKEHTALLKQLLKELPGRKLNRETGVRLMMAGPVHDDVGFMEMMESLGATCVIEENCMSTKFFWDEGKVGGDMVEAIANRYVTRWPCPVFDWEKTGEERERWKRIWSLAQEYRVEGAILYLQRFCGVHGPDLPFLRDLLVKHGIPVLMLEFDITVPVGQFRTRIEAFLEMLVTELV